MKISHFKLKHTAKLKTKQPDLKAFFIKFFVGALPLLCFYLIKNALSINHQFGINIPLQDYLKLIVYLLFLINTLFTLYVSPFSFSRVQRMKYTLRKIIEVNNFYYESKELNKIILSMKIKFYWIDNQLYLEVYPNGGKFTHKMNELTPTFQTALNLTVVSVQSDFADHTTYILCSDKDNYIDSTETWKG
ncbi:hypothetical protein [Solibacillus ferritrahens]|uniref:hypothetical protein n=1 Tax=Solibacillus ferritrahens TaxID=3098620 RepID=UPI003007F6C2